MENTINLGRPLYFLVVVIILSQNLNTKFKFNKILKENRPSPDKLYELSKAPILVMTPDYEHYTEEQCDLCILLSHFNRSQIMPVMCPKHDKLHCLISIAISKTEKSASQLTETFNGISFCPELLLKKDVIAILDKTHSSTNIYVMEYILFWLFIVIIFVNGPNTINPNLCKDDYEMVRVYVDRRRHFKRRTLKDANASIFEMLFNLRSQSVPKTNIVTNPSSFESYLKDIKNKTSKQDLMKNEWARYTSFRYFPKSSNMTPTRLAQAGFYYSGVGESVTCFSCGQKYDTWTEDETALEVHQRVSPNCAFMSGEDTTNISIHDTSNHGRIRPSNSNSTYTSSHEHQSNGANGGPDDIKTNPTSSTEIILSPSKTEHQRQIHQSEKQNVYKTPVCEESSTTYSKAMPSYLDTNPHETHLSSDRKGHYERSSPPSKQNGDRTPVFEGSPIIVNTSNPNARGSTDVNNITRSTRMSYDNAKHPEYAVKAVREDSYAGWREHMSLVELSEAGFYYAGFQDCVRCFYCGGGLKNWDYGDSPWVEHARWYPNCDYLRHAKGGEFVQMYREDGGIEEQQETTNNMINGQEIRGPCSTNEGNINMHHILDVDMNSAAVASVLEMGYSRDTIENTVRRYRQMNGNQSMTAESLMNIILDSDQSQNTSHSPSTSEANITTTLNISTREETASQRHPSNCNDKTTTKKEDKAVIKKTNTTANASTKADLTSLVEENRSLREQMLCKICMDNDANVVFLPCGHLVACTECAPSIRKCAVCRKIIKGTVRAFPS